MTDAAPRHRPLPRGSRRGLATLAVLAFAAVGPAVAAPLDLATLQVFALDSIQGVRSDYQGPTAAGGAINLQDFDVDGDLTAGGVVRFSRGQVHGAIRSPDVRLDKVFAGHARAGEKGDLSHLSAQLNALGARLACMPATISPVKTHGELLGKPLSMLRLTASGHMDVADLSSDDLRSSGPNQLRVVLTGTSSSHMIIRVHGTSATMRDVGFATQGGLGPSQIVFAFPDAQDLTIASSGGAIGPGGTEWGIPGSIVAPQSDLKLAAATVTGQVFVRSLAPVPGLPSGQINRFSPTALETRSFQPSVALQAVRSGVAFDCSAR